MCSSLVKFATTRAVVCSFYFAAGMHKTGGLFKFKKFLNFDNIAFLFLFDNHCLIKK